MTLDEARAILKGKSGSIDELGPAYVRHARAAETLTDHYRQNPHLLTRTTDAAPRRTRDIGAPSPNWSAARENPEAGGGRADGGKQPGSRSGPKLVQVLPGDVSAYFVAADGSGRACLYRTVEADDAIDPGTVRDRAALQREMRSRDQLRQLEQKVIVSGITAFWKQPTRDQQPQQPQRGVVSAANAAFWDRQHG